MGEKNNERLTLPNDWKERLLSNSEKVGISKQILERFFIFYTPDNNEKD